MRTIFKIMLSLFLVAFPLGAILGQAADNSTNNKKTLTIRPNSREDNPTRRDNLKAKTLNLKKPDAINPGKHLAKGNSKIKPNKKAILQRREAHKNRIKVQKRALRR